MQNKKTSADVYNTMAGKYIGSTLLSVQKLKNMHKQLKIRSNIATLTKKYARFLFHQASLNKDKDEFSK